MFGIWPQLIRNLVKDQENIDNPLLVTVGVAWTDILVSKVFNVVAGDRVLISIYMRGTKTLNAGRPRWEIEMVVGSTSTVELAGKDITVLKPYWTDRNLGVNEAVWTQHTFFMEVTASGTFRVRLEAFVTAADLDYAANEAGMQIVIFR